MNDRGDNFEGGPTILGMEVEPTLQQVDDTRASDESNIFKDEVEFAVKLIGTVFDEKYEIKRLIGQGGMGAVFEAQHLEIGSKFAIKVLFPEKRRKRESLARFRREARAAGTIGHPNIAKVLDMGKTSDGLSYLVMEFVEGESLADIVAREQILAADRVVSIIIKVLEALEAAHATGIVHRDIKPENVMVSGDPEQGDETVCVLDFGISKMRSLGTETQGLTQTGTILGTPMYMAPEQARGEPDIDFRIDLYAVGAMMYVMLSGQNPFQASNYNALLAKILTEEPPPLKTLSSDLDTHLIGVVEKAMARDREQRFSSAREFIEALQGGPVIPPTKLKSSSVETRGRRSRQIWLGIPVVLAIVLAGGLVVAQLFGLFSDGNVNEGNRRMAAEVGGVPQVDVGDLASDDAPAKARGGDDPRVTTYINVAIETVPSDARIYINGRLVTNPASEKLLRAEGETLVLRVEKEGYLDYEEIFPRESDVTQVIKLSKVPPRATHKAGPRTKSTGFRWGVD